MTMTKAQMTKYNVGDTITLENDNGDRLVREVLEDERGPVVRDVPGVAKVWSVGMVLRSGWRITSVTPKPAPLPTEPGSYSGAHGGTLYTLTDQGEWYYGEERRDSAQMLLNAPLPLVRLVPETAVTEAKTEAYREAYEWLTSVVPINSYRIPDSFAKRFGVTE